MTARLVSAVAVCVLALAGCSSSSEPEAGSAATSTIATPSPTPTPAEVVWAGDYCRQKKRLDAAVGSFGRNLNIDISGDIVKQVDRQLRIQALAAGEALSGMLATLALVPANLEGVSSNVNDMITIGQQAQGDLTGLGDQVSKVTAADNLLQAGAEAVTAASMAKAAYDKAARFVEAANALAKADDPELAQAMSQAPDCAAS